MLTLFVKFPCAKFQMSRRGRGERGGGGGGGAEFQLTDSQFLLTYRRRYLPILILLRERLGIDLPSNLNLAYHERLREMLIKSLQTLKDIHVCL